MHIIEPAVGGRRARISERGVKDHFSHIFVNAGIFPFGIVAARVQVVGCAWAGASVVVVVERQCVVRLCITGVCLLGIGAKGAHQGYQHDNQSLNDGCWFHIRLGFDDWAILLQI